ncbi:MAG: hypothetical protein HDQ98_10370 [Lachnospiraceae bacterium]|nr:hypothetical protein [Lachnospiraceae bacterium]
MRRRLQLLSIITGILVLGLTGCGHRHVWEDAACMAPKTCSECGETEGEALGHTWADATCAEPKTCSVCGETEGEALGHTWVDATCSEPKTCSVCGETEGDALEHTLSEANYQQAAVCEVCGESVGEPLQADFEKYNLTEHMVELDQEYDYRTLCYDDSAYTTVGKVIFSNYQTFDSDETHEAKEGYEWKSVDITAVFGDENAREYGMRTESWFDDYYDIIKCVDTSATDDDGIVHFTVNWNGVDYTECCFISTAGYNGWTDNTDPAYGDWERINVCQMHVEVLVPEGYDGIVFGVYNYATDWGDGLYVFEVDNTDTLFFRMD